MACPSSLSVFHENIIPKVGSGAKALLASAKEPLFLLSLLIQTLGSASPSLANVKSVTGSSDSGLYNHLNSGIESGVGDGVEVTLGVIVTLGVFVTLGVTVTLGVVVALGVTVTLGVVVTLGEDVGVGVGMFAHPNDLSITPAAVFQLPVFPL